MRHFLLRSAIGVSVMWWMVGTTVDASESPRVASTDAMDSPSPSPGSVACSAPPRPDARVDRLVRVARGTPVATASAPPSGIAGATTPAETLTTGGAVVIEDRSSYVDVTVAGVRWIVNGTFRRDAGVPADELTVAGVLSTLDAWVSCANARDTARLYGLFSDAGLLWLFAPNADHDRFFTGVAGLADPASPVPPDPLAPLPLAAVRLLPDGRVAAIVAFLDEPGGRDTFIRSVWFMSQVEDQWLIDEILPSIPDYPQFYPLPSASTPAS